MHRSLLAVALLIVFISGCAAPGQAPVIEDASHAPIERDTQADTEVRQPDQRASAQTSSATLALVTQAREASADDNHANAVAYLERAVRIEPRNPRLWTELSTAHLAQGNFAAANQHVRKAIALSRNDSTTSRLAWLALADIREAEGNTAEASAIRRRYRSGEG